MTLLPVLARLILTRCRWLFAGGDFRDAEILALRHQVLVLQRQINRPRFDETDRVVLPLLTSVMDQARRGRALLFVRPTTVTTSFRSAQANRSAYTPPAADSSTSTTTQPEPPDGRP